MEETEDGNRTKHCTLVAKRASVSAHVLNMKKIMINMAAGIQIAGATLLGLITVLKFEPEATWFLLGCVLTVLVALGLIRRSQLAFVTEFILLLPVCGLLVFQTARRVWGIFTGVWRDCPPAYIMGFVFEQIVLIPALCTGIVLLLCRSQFRKQKDGELRTTT